MHCCYIFVQDLVALRQHASDEFRASFHVGLTNYINGLWDQARTALLACDAMLQYIGGKPTSLPASCNT